MPNPAFPETGLSFETDLVSLLERDPKLQECIQCGTCSGICPYGYLMEFPPSKMIASLRAGTFERILDAETVWMCIACSACTTVCPSQIPITEYLITRVKESKILSGDLPTELQVALEHSQRYGNPLGESARKRVSWTKELDFEVPVLGSDAHAVDILWFVGDYGSYHPRLQPVTQATARILRALDVDFGILGRDENSDGDSQRMAGEKGLFELLAEKNLDAFGKVHFNRIITGDPHAYNAIKNHYPQLNGSHKVQHITEFLAEKLDEFKHLLTTPQEYTITFHDPCYLGRVNEIYDAPRTLLSAIPGVTLVEMAHSRQTSLCCGGGGGGMWIDGFHWEKAGTRISEWRVQEAVLIGADILAVACPYEIPRFEDAVKNVKGAERMQVKDVCTLLFDSIAENY